jgi:Beta-galactosidase
MLHFIPTSYLSQTRYVQESSARTARRKIAPTWLRTSRCHLQAMLTCMFCLFLFACASGPAPVKTVATRTTLPKIGTNAVSPKVVKKTAGFKGIYEFSGHNSSDNVNNPALAGTYLGYYWKQLEPQEGQFNWNVIDHDMQPWVANGKNVILRVATAGWTNWNTAADSQHGTPPWVYAHGVASVTEVDGAVLPQYWASYFLQSLNAFVQAFANHYDSNPHVSAIEVGIGDGGETKVDTRKGPNVLTQWQAIGYTDELWWQTVQQIAGFYIASFHHTPLVLMPDATFIGKTYGYHQALVLNYAVQHGLWLQDNGLVANRVLGAQWQQVPGLIAEQQNTTQHTGDTLMQDLMAGLTEKATYILIYGGDINSANQAALQQVAALAHG